MKTRFMEAIETIETALVKAAEGDLSQADIGAGIQACSELRKLHEASRVRPWLAAAIEINPKDPPSGDEIGSGGAVGNET